MRTFLADEFDCARLVAAKGTVTVSVCLPARDEAPTIGPIIETIVAELVERHPLVDEVVVIDDGSQDQTAAIAAAAGAVVVRGDEVLAELGHGQGKGDALWKSLVVSTGDIVAWCDADVTDFDPRFVTGLVGPLLTHPHLEFVKGFYERPLDGRPGEGGRVTELVARPVLALLFPHLTSIVQPLAGEYAGRRRLLERLPFATSYGVDLALLIDAVAEVGLDAVAQVDLGVRVHRNRSLAELSLQAMEVLNVALRRAGIDVVDSPVLHRPGLAPAYDASIERPPLLDVAAYRRQVS